MHFGSKVAWKRGHEIACLLAPVNWVTLCEARSMSEDSKTVTYFHAAALKPNCHMAADADRTNM